MPTIFSGRKTQKYVEGLQEEMWVIESVLVAMVDMAREKNRSYLD